jgi:hypothetical protein
MKLALRAFALVIASAAYATGVTAASTGEIITNDDAAPRESPGIRKRSRFAWHQLRVARQVDINCSSCHQRGKRICCIARRLLAVHHD